MMWDTTNAEYARQAAADPAWDLERRIQYGLEGTKLDRALLEQYLPNLRIPEDRRAFLELIVWGKPF